MITQLDGFNPLQNKILMYCLGSPSASVMKPLCARLEAKRQEREDEDENEMTVWRYYNKKFKTVNLYGTFKKYNRFGSFLGYCVIEELRLMKEQDPTLKAEGIQNQKRLRQTLVEIRQFELNRKEENGTPTGIIMRKYMTNLFDRGLKLMENETMWARFSFGQLSSRRSEPIADILQPEVRVQLTKALNEKNAIYKKNRAK
jgi:hypothetical protein